MDDRFSESFDLAHETNFINQSAKKLLEYSIYPSDDEFREATEDFLAENHTEFYDSMTNKKWNTYYKKNIAQPHRSLQSALTTCVKDAIFSVFGESQLDSINTNVTPADDPKQDVARQVTDQYKMAYAIAICQIMLNDYYKKLTIFEDTVKDRLRRNLKFLPLGEGESTEDEEDEMVEEERVEEKEKKTATIRKYKRVKRTKSPINISDAETSEATPKATPKATSEATQEEPLERSFTASAGYLATPNEPQEGYSTASAGYLATHNEPQEGSFTASAGHLATPDA
ncbi:hypothetical protein C2G38_2233456 [Gigaspora rosea]|uniref:Uncharacterized protein n=1 Tax=Gigaspora rosea TaxID=44941 RepID=A0A397TZU7_9GLOM|nr:hypothetical protein C2G38_2233456 [Gigaspora rosea]